VSERSSQLRSSAVMAAGTIVSRLTGFVRGAMLAAAIGLGFHADLFNVANTVPNMLYILVAGGIFNVVLVPQIVRAMKSDPDGGEAYVNRILTLSGLFLAAVTIVLVAAAPWVMRLIAGERMFDPDLEEQTESFITFARFCLPQVFFYGVFVLMGQVLNARRRFGPMMWAPITNNLVSIAVLAVYLLVFGPTASDTAAYTSGEELLLGLGSTAGIVVQALVLVPYLRAAGVRYRPRFDYRGTGLGHTLRIAAWTVGFVVINQIAYVVVVRLNSAVASRAALAGEESAGFTVYSQSFLLLMVPHAVVTVSLATAALPRLSALSADGELNTLRRELAETLRDALAVILPFCVLLTVLAPFLAIVLLGYGAAAGETGPVAVTLVAFSPGLLLFTVHYLMLRGFYALEDTRTPFFVQCAVAATNIGAAVGLTWAVDTFQIAPWLALAYGSAYLVGACASVTLLTRRVGGSPLVGVVGYVTRLLVASVPAAAAAYGTAGLLGRTGMDLETKVGAVTTLAAAGIVAMLVFAVLARVLRIGEVMRIIDAAFGRLRRIGKGKGM
jgi:putative peptidoglycan lipid II flippase